MPAKKYLTLLHKKVMQSFWKVVLCKTFEIARIVDLIKVVTRFIDNLADILDDVIFHS